MLRHLFISYAHSREDEEAAFRVAAILEAAGVAVWIDRMRLKSQTGVGLNEEIAAGLQGADAVVSIVSGYALASPYVQAELVFALERSLPVLRLELEPCALPGPLLPLGSSPRASLVGRPPDSWPGVVLAAVAELGVRVSTPETVDPLLSSDARAIRPSYRRLRDMNEAEWRTLTDRLVLARAISPGNGYNALSLALVRLVLRDFPGALADAEAAVRQLPSEGEAYYVRALVNAAARPLRELFDNQAQSVLQDLARARRLPNPGAHVDALTALVLEGHYVFNSKTPPAEPNALLGMAMQRDRVRVAEEIERVLDMVADGSEGLRREIAALAKAG